MKSMVNQMGVAPPHTVDAVSRLLRTLSDPTRLRLLGLLEGGQRNVTALREHLDRPQPTVSHHLALLRSAELVVDRRDGKQVYYSLNPAVVSTLEDGSGLGISLGAVQMRIDRAGLNGSLAEDHRSMPIDQPERRAAVAV